MFKTNIANVAQEKHFYPAGAEKYLSSKIEGPTKSILDKIKRNEPLTLDERFTFTTFMNVFLKRVPRHKGRIDELTPKVISSVFANLDRRINDAIEENPEKREIYNQKRQEAKEIQKKWKKELPKDLLDKVLFPGPSLKVIEFLFRMTWIFYILSDESKLLTNDNPVFYFEWKGIGKNDSEVSFPLFSNMFLWASWRPDLVEGYYKASEKIVREINRRTASAATRYIFYHKKSDWVSTLANKQDLKLNRIV